jgi:thiol-disulfide isomerase/thioredoxin
LSITALAILGLLGYFIVKITQKSQQKARANIATAQIPNFSKKEKLLKNNTPSVFIAFHPECEHCQYEAKSINEKQKELENTNIVLFTEANDSLTKAFAKTYGLDTLKNVHVLTDSTNEMRRLFDIKTIPTVFIYNAQNQLVKRFNGETKIEAILKYTQ